MLALGKRGKSIEPTTVARELERAGELEAVGGTDGLLGLLAEMPPVLVDVHVDHVVDAALRRRLRDAVRELPRIVDAATSAAEALAATRDHLGAFSAEGVGGRRMRVVAAAELARRPRPAPVVHGIIYRGELATLCGRPGAGKSLVALDMACAVATGRPWLGRATARGPVLYVAAEGIGGMGARLRAWHNGAPLADDVLADLGIVEGPIDLLGNDSVLLRGEVEQRRAVLVIIDTLAMSMPAANENAAGDMGAVLCAVRAIAQPSDAATLLLHHWRKHANGEDRERGSSALRGGADVMYDLEAPAARAKLD
jgi:hypothetical protein